MLEQFIPYSKYPNYFRKLVALRRSVARDLPIKAGMRILDIATGDGFFAVEIARLYRDVKVIGIDISPIIVEKARNNIRRRNLQHIIEVVEMDATNMRFSTNEFDIVVDFTGLEDIQMTRGIGGVQQTLFEVNRVLKPNGHFCFAEMFSDRMETKAQKIEVNLFSYICRGDICLSTMDYKVMLEKAKFNLIEEKSYYSGLKFTPQQAKREIKYVIKNAQRIYGIKTPSFKDVWAKFGKEIEENGVGCYSKVTLIIAKKSYM